MFRTKAIPTLFVTAVLAAMPMASAFAQQQSEERRSEERRQDNNRNERRAPPAGSLSDAVRRVERNTRGEVLSAERVQYDGRDMHRVKVVDDRGRVRVFMQEPARQQENGRDRSRRNDQSRPQRQQQRRPTRDDDN